MTVALSWGTALQSMVYATTTDQTYHGLILCQLVGGLSTVRNEISGQALVRELAVRLGADYRFLHAPAALESSAARDALLAEPSISESLAQAARADLAFVGIGTPTHGSSEAVLESLGLSASERKGFWAAGPVGDVAARYYNAAGAPLHGAVEDRVLGRLPDRPRRHPQRRRRRVRPGQDARRPRRSARPHHRLPRLRREPRAQRAQRRAAPRGRHPHHRKERLMDSALIILAAVVGGWIVQMYLTYQQSDGLQRPGARPAPRRHRERRRRQASATAADGRTSPSRSTTTGSCATRSSSRGGPPSPAARRSRCWSVRRPTRFSGTGTTPASRSNSARRPDRPSSCSGEGVVARPAPPREARAGPAEAATSVADPTRASRAGAPLEKNGTTTDAGQASNGPTTSWPTRQEKSCQQQSWPPSCGLRRRSRSTSRPASSEPWRARPTGSSASSRPAARSSWASSSGSSRPWSSC